MRLLLLLALTTAVACASPRNEPLAPDPASPMSPAAPVSAGGNADAAVEPAPKPPAPVDAAAEPPPKPPASVDAAPKPPASVDMASSAPPPPPPPSCSTMMGQKCESCGGTYGCDGNCQSRASANHGKSCDSCGGTFDCDGVCQTTADPRAGKDCDTCGAKFDCSGTCNTPNVIETVRHVRLTNANSEDPMGGQRTACEPGWEFASCEAKDHHCAVYKNDIQDLSECNCFAAPQVDSTFPLECEIHVTRHRIGCNLIF